MQRLDPENFVLLNIEAKGHFMRFAVPRHWSVFYAARYAWENLVGESAMNQHFSFETSEGRYLVPWLPIGRDLIDEQFVRVVERREELA